MTHIPCSICGAESEGCGLMGDRLVNLCRRHLRMDWRSEIRSRHLAARHLDRSLGQ